MRSPQRYSISDISGSKFLGDPFRYGSVRSVLHMHAAQYSTSTSWTFEREAWHVSTHENHLRRVAMHRNIENSRFGWVTLQLLWTDGAVLDVVPLDFGTQNGGWWVLQQQKLWLLRAGIAEVTEAEEQRRFVHYCTVVRNSSDRLSSCSKW